MNKHRADHQALHEAYQQVTQNEAKGGMWDKMISKVASRTGMGARAADRVQGKNDEKQMIRHFNASVLGNMSRISKPQLAGWLKNLVKLDASELSTIDQLPDTFSNKDALNALPEITQELRVMKQTGTGYNTDRSPVEVPPAPEQPVEPVPSELEVEPDSDVKTEPIEPEQSTNKPERSSDWLDTINIDTDVADKIEPIEYKTGQRVTVQTKKGPQTATVTGGESAPGTTQVKLNGAIYAAKDENITAESVQSRSFNQLGQPGFMNSNWGRF